MPKFKILALIALGYAIGDAIGCYRGNVVIMKLHGSDAPHKDALDATLCLSKTREVWNNR